jgi:hypothetical protein
VLISGGEKGKEEGKGTIGSWIKGVKKDMRLMKSLEGRVNGTLMIWESYRDCEANTSMIDEL